MKFNPRAALSLLHSHIQRLTAEALNFWLIFLFYTCVWFSSLCGGSLCKLPWFPPFVYDFYIIHRIVGSRTFITVCENTQCSSRFQQDLISIWKKRWGGAVIKPPFITLPPTFRLIYLLSPARIAMTVPLCVCVSVWVLLLIIKECQFIWYHIMQRNESPYTYACIRYIEARCAARWFLHIFPNSITSMLVVDECSSSHPAFVIVLLAPFSPTVFWELAFRRSVTIDLPGRSLCIHGKSRKGNNAWNCLLFEGGGN